MITISSKIILKFICSYSLRFSKNLDAVKLSAQRQLDFLFNYLKKGE